MFFSICRWHRTMTTTHPHGRSRPTYNTPPVSVGREQAQERTQGPKAKACELAYNRNGRSPQDTKLRLPWISQASHTASDVHGEILGGPLTPALVDNPHPTYAPFLNTRKRWSMDDPPDSQASKRFFVRGSTLLLSRLLYRNGAMGLSGCSLCGV